MTSWPLSSVKLKRLQSISPAAFLGGILAVLVGLFLGVMLTVVVVVILWGYVPLWMLGRG
jgi:hypothetical protein